MFGFEGVDASQLTRSGAESGDELCVIVHRPTFDPWSTDLARHAILAIGAE